MDAVLATNPATALRESGPTVATALQVTAPNVPPPAPATEEKARPDFRLNGIIFTVARPAAIVNGKTVFVGDWVSGATVAAIERTYVTLQINGRKACVFLKGTD